MKQTTIKQNISTVEFNEEAINESITYFTRDEYQQTKANRTLAEILEVVREFSNSNRQTDFRAIRQIVRMFPE